MRTRLYLMVLLLAFWNLAKHAHALPIVAIDVPGATATAVTGVNSAGDLVGRYSASGNQGFVFRGGTFQEIVIPDAAQGVFPESINNFGAIAGYYVTATGRIRGFVRTSIGTTPVDLPGSNGTLVMAINDAGDYVGSGVNNNTGFLFRNGILEDIVIPGASQGVFPQSISNSGQVGGYFVNSAGSIHGFLWDDGTAVVIDPPGSGGTLLTGVNVRGELVGSTTNSGGFLFREGRFENVTIDGAGQGAFPEEISDRGHAAGYYVTDAGRIRGFVTAATISSPSSIWLLALGFSLFAGFFGRSCCVVRAQ